MTLYEYYVDRLYDGLSGLAAEATMYQEKADVVISRRGDLTPDGVWLAREVFDGRPSWTLRLYFRYVLWRACREGRCFPWGGLRREAGCVVLSSLQLPVEEWLYS